MDVFTIPAVTEPVLEQLKAETKRPNASAMLVRGLDAARRLLRETSKSVITIANEVGYSNPSHFAQLFRKEAGLSPTDYRRQK